MSWYSTTKQPLFRLCHLAIECLLPKTEAKPLFLPSEDDSEPDENTKTPAEGSLISKTAESFMNAPASNPSASLLSQIAVKGRRIIDLDSDSDCDSEVLPGRLESLKNIHRPTPSTLTAPSSPSPLPHQSLSKTHSVKLVRRRIQTDSESESEATQPSHKTFTHPTSTVSQNKNTIVISSSEDELPVPKVTNSV